MVTTVLAFCLGTVFGFLILSLIEMGRRSMVDDIIDDVLYREEDEDDSLE